MGTSNYSLTFPTTSDSTPENLWSTHHFSNPFEFHTWAPPIIHPNLPPPPISHLGTFNYTSNFATSPNFTTGNIWLPTHLPFHLQFQTRAPPITSYFPHNFKSTLVPLPLFIQFHHHPQFHTRAQAIHLISPTFPMSQLGTSDYPPTSTTTCNFTHGHIQLPIHFLHIFQFHTLDTSDQSPTFPITSNFTHGHLPLPTQFYHHSQFQTWAHLITYPLSPPLPISQMGTSNHPPTLPITSNFQPRHLPLPTQFQSPSHFTITSIFTPVMDSVNYCKYS